MALNGSDGAWTCLFVHFTGAAYVCFRGDVRTRARVDIVIILHHHHNLLSLVVMMIAGLLASSHTDTRNGSPWEEHLQKNSMCSKVNTSEREQTRFHMWIRQREKWKSAPDFTALGGAPWWSMTETRLGWKRRRGLLSFWVNGSVRD